LAAVAAGEGLAAAFVVVFAGDFEVGVAVAVLGFELLLDVVCVGVTVGFDAAAPPEVDAAFSFPDAALLALEVATAWCALLISDLKAPTPWDEEEPLPPPLEECGFSANIHSAKNTTVPIRRAISERDAGIANPIIGRGGLWHEPVSRVVNVDWTNV
jgi:hypothetical protein